MHGAARRFLLIALSAALGACGGSPPSPPREPEKTHVAELRSWIVVGRARHLFLDVRPIGDDSAVSRATRIEFTTVMLRNDYRYTLDRSGGPRVGRYVGTAALRPLSFAPAPDGRLEARYELTAEQRACLERDRVFSEAYVLVGPNSNAAMRRVCEECGLSMPEEVRSGGGVFGEFPGIDSSVGAEVPRAEWSRFGVVPGGF